MSEKFIDIASVWRNFKICMNLWSTNYKLVLWNVLDWIIVVRFKKRKKKEVTKCFCPNYLIGKYYFYLKRFIHMYTYIHKNDICTWYFYTHTQKHSHMKKHTQHTHTHTHTQTCAHARMYRLSCEMICHTRKKNAMCAGHAWNK